MLACLRGSAVCVLAVSSFLAPCSASLAAEMSTANHPLPSSIALDVYLGDPDFDGVLLGTIGPLAITGAGVVSSSLDGVGDGSFEVTDSQFAIESAMGTLNLDPLGTVDVVLDDIGFTFTTQSKPVAGHAFEFPFDSTSSIVFNQGSAIVQNATGVLLSLVGPGVIYDHSFSDSPYAAQPSLAGGLPFFGTVDDGVGLNTPLAELNFFMPSISTIFETLGGDFPPLYLNFRADVHVAAPEPSSWALAIVGLAGFGLLRRRMKRATT